MCSTSHIRRWWLAALICLAFCGSSQTIRADSGSRFSITGSLAMRSINGKTHFGRQAMDITSPSVTHLEYGRCGNSVTVRAVHPVPMGYELNSKLFYGSALQVNFRFWRGMEFSLSFQGYASKSGGSKLNWSAESVGLDNGETGSLEYKYKFFLFDVKLLLEYHFGYKGLFVRAGLERFVYSVERTVTWTRSQYDTLQYSTPSEYSYFQNGSEFIGGVGHSLRFWRKISLINILSFSGGHMTRGIRFESGLRYHF